MPTTTDILAQLDNLRAEVCILRMAWGETSPWTCKLTLKDHNDVKAEVQKSGKTLDDALEAAWAAISHVAAKGLNMRQLAAPTVETSDFTTSDIPF